MFNVGPAELLIISLLLLPVGITIWGLVDAASRPDWAWDRAGHRKLLWILLQAVGVGAPFLLIGFVSSVFYLSAIRPKLRSAQLLG